MYAFVLLLALVGAGSDYTGLVWVKSTTCPPCAAMQPTVEKLVLEGQPIIIIIADTQADLAKYDSSTVPVTLAYKHGKRTAKVGGRLSEADLRKMLAKLAEEP